MNKRDRWYRLVLHAYPRDFRQDHGQEMLTTLSDMREANRGRGALRDLASMLWGGGRQRWLTGTGGSLSITLRQGAAWAVLVLIARQVGLAAQDVFGSLIKYGQVFSFGMGAAILVPLLVGWLATFCLLASGRRAWGLAALTATLIGFTYCRIQITLDYGGRFDLPWTLGFFLPVVLPLLAAYAWPPKGMRLRARWWMLWLVPSAVIGPLSGLGWTWGPSWFAQMPLVWLLTVVGALVIGLTALIMGLCDPRWLVAAALLVMAWEAKHALPVISGRSLFLDTIVPLVVLWVFIPGICFLVVRLVSKRAVRAR